jgi:hypothetical protein
MSIPYAIGAVAGVASALLFASGAAGPVALALLLFLLSPLPFVLAALGWGPRASILAALAGASTTAATYGPRLSLVYLLSIALPVPLLCWLAFLSRHDPGGPGRPASVEWYPIGRIVAWAALIAGGLSLLSLLAMGGDGEDLRKAVRGVLERQAREFGQVGARELSAAQLEAMTGLFVRILPAASAASWMFMMLGNLWLGARVLLASGRLARPWPDIPAFSLPPLLAIGLGVALLALGAGGLTSLAAGGFASAFMIAYALTGLAVVHTLTRGSAYRPLALAFAYLAALVLAPWGTVIIALLGLLDAAFGLRARSGKAGGRGGPPAPFPPTS